MSKFKRWLAYWRESLAECQDVYDMIIYVVFLLAVFVAVAGEFAGFKISGLDFIADPLTHKISIIAAILIFVWILAWLPFQRHELERKKYEELLEKTLPKLRFSCNKNTDGKLLSTPNKSAGFFRVKVETDCVQSVKSCMGHLLKIEKDGVILFEGDSLELPFAKSENPNSFTKRINKDSPEWLDIFIVFKHQKGAVVEEPENCQYQSGHYHGAISKVDDKDIIYFATRGYLPAANKDGKYIFENSGEYFLSINVTSDDNTSPAVLKFNWTGYGHSSSLEVVQ